MIAQHPTIVIPVRGLMQRIGREAGSHTTKHVLIHYRQYIKYVAQLKERNRV